MSAADAFRVVDVVPIEIIGGPVENVDRLIAELMRVLDEQHARVARRGATSACAPRVAGVNPAGL